MRKIFALALAVMMVMSLATTAFADEVPGENTENTPKTYSITIDNDATGHTYEAYQIFVGDLSSDAENDAVADTDAVLSNIEWGASVANADDLEDAAEVAEKLAEGTLTVDALLEMIVLGEEVATSGESSNPYVISGLAPGYYLVKDKDGTVTGHDAYTEFILEVIENSTVTPKSSVPSVEKKVDDKNDSNTSEDEIEWEDSADHDIGDKVSFQLTATLADNVSAYDTYKIVFHDTLSAGLTYNNDAKVYFEGNDVTSYFTITHEGGKLTISCNNVKAFGASDSDVITVEYTATLNENADLGSAGNPNTVKLEFSNNPNWEYDETNPDEKEPTGETPEDKVIVFTYKVVVNKVDENETPLAGAGFTLYKKNAAGEYVAIGEELKGDALTTFAWAGLDDGEYKLVETTTPAGYNTIAPLEFTITAEHETESDDPRLTALNGGNLFTGDVATGTLTTDVENKAGTTLPETGGMGTTIFYALGGILVLAAVVLLVTKRRMNMAE